MLCLDGKLLTRSKSGAAREQLPPSMAAGVTSVHDETNELFQYYQRKATGVWPSETWATQTRAVKVKDR